jgi:hypothetical protein
MTTIWVPPDFNRASVDELVDDYSNAQHERKPHGLIFIDGKEVASTLMCPHCGAHFVSRKGSGIRRTLCIKHMAVTCGHPKCDPCTDMMGEMGMSDARMI